MATVTKGRTFVSGETVTPAKLNELVDSATVSAIQTADISDSQITTAKIADASSTTTGVTNSKIRHSAALSVIGNSTNAAAAPADIAAANDGEVLRRSGTAVGFGQVATAGIADSAVTAGKIAGAAVTAAKLDGAQTGSAPIYGCRAWVNFQGDAAADLNGTYSQSGTTVTVTATAHGHIVGHKVNANITSGTGVDGTYTITSVPTANTFTYTAGTSLTTSGNVTLRRRLIRASGNVHSIIYTSQGNYSLNFATPMPDANYCLSFWARYGGSTLTGTTGRAIISANGGSTYNEYVVDLAARESNTGVGYDWDIIGITVIR